MANRTLETERPQGLLERAVTELSKFEEGKYIVGAAGGVGLLSIIGGFAGTISFGKGAVEEMLQGNLELAAVNAGAAVVSAVMVASGVAIWSVVDRGIERYAEDKEAHKRQLRADRLAIMFGYPLPR